MTDKIYQVVLLGKLAEGYDVEIVYEKLAIVFEIDLKKIPKLLKKPTVIRKNLAPDVALKYKNGLEKIGVLCEIRPPLVPSVEENINTSEEVPPTSLETESIPTNETPADNNTEAEPQTISLAEEPQPLVLDQETLRVINIKLPWWSMTKLIIKLVFATIPALIILATMVYLVVEGIRIAGLLL